MQGIKITTDNKISVIDIDLNDYNEICDELGCSIFECVGTQLLDSYFMRKTKMLIDEEGLCNDLDFNAVGSFFYGTEKHGSPIVGDVLFFHQEGPELIGMDNASLFILQLMSDFSFLEFDEQ